MSSAKGNSSIRWTIIAYYAQSIFEDRKWYCAAQSPYRDPTNLKLLGFTPPADRRPGSSIAANGSGLVLLAGTQVEGTAGATP